MTAPPPPPYPPRHPRRRASLALALATSAAFGGAGGAVFVGSPARAAQPTVVQQAAATTPAGLDAESLYTDASAGVVDITARGSGGDGTGTGFVIDEDGHILTAAHVVDDASTVEVELQDGTTREARVLGSDDAIDAAVLAIDPAGTDLEPLPLGSSGDLAVGEDIAAVGDPFGYERSISTGIVSGLDRTIDAPNGFTVAHAIQTDAAMNPGNSGGPVLEATGAVVGIADQIATGGAEQSSGVGFAIPIDLVVAELDQLKAGEDVEHAYLGVATAEAPDGGAAVATVAPEGPAATAGLRQGDVITAVAGGEIGDSSDVAAAIAGHQPGDEVAVTVRRGGRTSELTVTLGSQPTGQ